MTPITDHGYAFSRAGGRKLYPENYTRTLESNTTGRRNPPSYLIALSSIMIYLSICSRGRNLPTLPLSPGSGGAMPLGIGAGGRMLPSRKLPRGARFRRAGGSWAER
jgi:hypothetical protein